MDRIKLTLMFGICVMVSGIALGALGAHALRPSLEEAGNARAWDTAVLYQLVHGLALFTTGFWMASREVRARPRLLFTAVVLWVAGIVFFSGSIYTLSLGGPRWLGPVTPLGGLCFLAGWIVLAIGVARMETSVDTSS